MYLFHDTTSRCYTYVLVGTTDSLSDDCIQKTLAVAIHGSHFKLNAIFPGMIHLNYFPQYYDILSRSAQKRACHILRAACLPSNELTLLRPVRLLLDRRLPVQLPLRVHSACDLSLAGNLAHVAVVRDVHLAALVFWAEECEEDDINLYIFVSFFATTCPARHSDATYVDTPHKNTDNCRN